MKSPKFVMLCIGVFILTVTVNLSCSTRAKKYEPAYTGVDERAKPYVDEFFRLSHENDIRFSNDVSIGFTNKKRGMVIGTCTYANSFREIDLDSEFFSEASEKRKKALIFHELVHCYCGRDHDFGKDMKYAEGIYGIIVFTFKKQIPWCLVKTPPGFLDDGCASSIMHPIILEDACLDRHWDYYMKEMFDRCDPY